MMRHPRVTVVLVFLALVTAGVLRTAETGRAQPASRALPQDARHPATNPSDARKVALGRLLFWDPILSGRKDVACATCHHPSFGYAENLDLSIGVNGLGLGSSRRFQAPNTIPFVKRNSQSILNVAFNGIDQSGRYDPANAPMFWDLRVSGLEAQALEPIESFEEMRGDAFGEAEALEAVTARLAGIPEYRTLFSRAFGGSRAVTAENVGKALAAFQRTLNANHSPFDRYMRGDLTAMTPDQVRGMEQFDRAGCANYHSGPMFSECQTMPSSRTPTPALPAPTHSAPRRCGTSDTRRPTCTAARSRRCRTCWASTGPAAAARRTQASGATSSIRCSVR
jgi:cytochrome c peroxidase